MVIKCAICKKPCSGNYQMKTTKTTPPKIFCKLCFEKYKSEDIEIIRRLIKNGINK